MIKTLVVKLGALGDVLRVTPVIHSLHDSGHAIDVVTSDVGLQVLRNNPYVKKSYKINHRKNPFELFFLTKQLRKKGYDIIVNFESQEKISSIFNDLDCGKRLNLDGCRPEMGNVNSIFYGVVRELLKPDGVMYPNELFPTEDDRKHVNAFLEGFAPSRKVGIHVGTSKTNRLFAKNFLDVRLWPVDRYIELTQQLVEKGYAVYLTGSRLEKNVNEKIAKAVGHRQVLNASGMFNIQQLQLLIAQMDWFVSGDTGPAHIAASVAVRQICLCGPTDANHSAPLKTSNLYRIQKNPDICPPCYATDKERKRNCRDNTCMTNISVEDVMKIICG